MSNEELVIKYKNGDSSALDVLIENNKRLVYKLASKFYTERTSSIDIEDIIQEGNIGLLIACKKYDPLNDKRAKFITYAVYHIYQKMSYFVKTKNTNDEYSLNAPIVGYEEDSCLLDIVKDDFDYIEDIDNSIYNDELRKDLESVMSKCNQLSEIEVLKLRNGWDTEIMTLQDISDLLEIPLENVRRIEKRALKKIRASKWFRDNWFKYRAEKLKSLDYNFSAAETIVDLKAQFIRRNSYGS